VVAVAETHPVFGRVVEIDHGNDLRTLYAHASRIDVKVGEIVRLGQKIAEVGSTGRSTGPHLHFEVHLRGQPQNPSRFLATQKAGSPFGPIVTASGRAVDVKGLARAGTASR
jgi:murein DD-endopeptidase MepM/ murein hydrolase activator NlpD